MPLENNIITVHPVQISPINPPPIQVGFFDQDHTLSLMRLIQQKVRLIIRISLKPCKLCHLASDEDYITNLHETVVSHILSHLPTKDAVRTSILSKDWRYKWTSLYNVDISDKTIKFRGQIQLFVDFVDRVLSLCQSIRSLHLDFTLGRYGSSLKETWISTALRNLESLELSLTGVVFPNSLLSSTRLRELKLQYRDYIFNVVSKNYAPNLTSLYLRVVFVNCDPNTSTPTFTFPLLETLTLRYCKWLNVKSVEIYAPSLTTFTSQPTNDDEDYHYSFVIHAPRLAMFQCLQGLPEKFILDGSSIVSAFFCTSCLLVPKNVGLHQDIGLRVGKLLSKFTSLEKLELSRFMVEECRLVPQLPRLDKLRKLTLRGHISTEHLLGLLHATPSLESLNINVVELVDFDYGVVKSVPPCIVSHLEEVKFTVLKWETPQYSLANFLLKNGQRMNKVAITDLPCWQRNEVGEYLTLSRGVQLHMDEAISPS